MKKTILALLILVSSFAVFAQGVPVKGVVTSAEDGQPIPGVSVVLKGTTIGNITDVRGNYSLNIPENSTLVFSFVGMKTQEVPVGIRKVVNIVLAPEQTDIDEVVVVGYGTQKKSLVTGAISKIGNDDLKKTSDMRVTQAIQGKTAGVVISSNSGQPGDQVSIRIRGIGTNGDAEPLYIIDGLPMSGAGTDFLNSNDVESVEILKDAASSAIYGARGANGVILITTKSGRKNSGY